MGTSGNKRIVKNTFFLYGRMAFALIVSLYTSRIVINTLGVVDYGINNVVAGFVSMFAFLNSSLTASIQRYYNFEKGKNGISGVKRVYNVSIVSQFLLALFVFILIEVFGSWYIYNKMVIPLERAESAYVLFQLTIMSTLLLIMQIPYSAVVMAFEKMNFFALVGVCDTLLRLLIVLSLPYLPYDKLIAFGSLGLIISLFDLCVYYLYVKRNFDFLSFNFKFDRTLLKSIFSFSGWNMFGSFAIMLRGQGLNLLINLFFGPIVNAARGVAYSIQSAMMGFVYNLTAAARPQLTESYAQGNKQRSVSLMYGISKMCFVLLYTMSLPVVCEIHYILHLWLGETVPKYTEGFVLLVLATSLVDVLNTPVSIMMLAKGNIRDFNVTASILGLLSIPLCYIWLKLGGNPYSVFFAGFIISVVVQIACVYIMCKEITINIFEYLKKVVLPLLELVVLTAFIPYILKMFIDESVFRLSFTIVLSIFSTLVISLFFVLSKSEKQTCLNYIKSKI